MALVNSGGLSISAEDHVSSEACEIKKEGQFRCCFSLIAKLLIVERNCLPVKIPSGRTYLVN